MRICDRVFCQNLHIAYFSTYNGIFRIAYEKIMPHMQKFTYMLHISTYAITFFSIFLVQRCFESAKYFSGKRLPVFAIRCWISWSRKCQSKGLFMIVIMILCHSNLHMRKIGRICTAYAAYMPHISPNSAYFASKSSTYFKKILCYKPRSLVNTFWLESSQKVVFGCWTCGNLDVVVL